MYFVFEIVGTVAFAISGAMVAVEKKMDILGVIILGLTTATGGGIIRDILIGVAPPTTLMHPMYAVVAIATSVIVFFPFVRRYIDVNDGFLVFVDALGLGIFTIVGCNAAIPFDRIWIQLFLGVLTGVGGGVLRDIFAAEKPMIFVKHIYAMASLIGATVYSLLLPLNEGFAGICGIVIVVALRMLAARYKWHLPKAK